MIRGVHTMLYTSEAEELRAFLRDKLGFEARDAGGGWLLMQLPPADMGCHPDNSADGQPSGTHHVSFQCDEIESTVKELEARGVEFTTGVVDKGYGLAASFRVPGGFEMELYEPRHPSSWSD
jgi:catechol 2,3-dioxygenase-like lactoylglutathione lyase family enzyme